MIAQKLLVELEAPPEAGGIDGEQLTGRGLLGMFYEVMGHYDEKLASSLHGNGRPNPFTLTPLFSPLGELERLQIVSLSAAYEDVFAAAWQTAVERRLTLNWGPQTFHARQVQCEKRVHLGELATSEPARIVGLNFLSPTAFKAGPETVPLPLAHSVFRRPFHLWNQQAGQQPMLQLPESWLDWCQRDVFIYSHDICTKQVTIHPRQAPMIGFVGEVWFRAHQGSEVQLSILHALARFAAFSGVGCKTAMGMGSVDFVAALNSL